jgi:hypothetical protein
MEKVTDRGIRIERRNAGGFTLSYATDNSPYCRKRYIGYGIREAERRFKGYAYAEDAKASRNTAADGAPVMAGETAPEAG